MSVSKPSVENVAPAGEAVGRRESNGADSTLYLYKLIDRQREIHAEIICQRHRDECSQPGRHMADLSKIEKARGYEQRFTPFVNDGEHGCELCAEEQETGAA